MITGDIVYNDRRIAIFDVGWDQRVKSFLACGVPQLHSETLILNVDSLAHKVDSDSWLHSRGDTCSLPVKLSKMNRLMMEVLPTDWSPSSTILHFIGLPSISALYLN